MPLRTIGNLLVGRKYLYTQARRYAQTVHWLYRAVFRFRPGITIVALVANVAGPMLMGASLTLLVYIAHKLESGTPLTLERFQITVQPREPEGFVLLVLLIGLSLLIGGIVVFLANRINIRLAVDFALAQSLSILAMEAGRPSGHADPIAGPYPKEVINRATGVIFLARGVRPLLQVFRPLLFLLISMAALLYTAPFLTIIVIVVALPSLLFQYQINYTAAQNQKLLGQAKRKMQKGITTLLDSLAWAPRVAQSETNALSAAYSGENIREYPERYIIRTMASPKSQAVSNVLIAAMAMIIVIFLGVSALNEQISWTMVVGYVVFAKMAMTALRGLLGVITGFARHYPKARMAYDLLNSQPRQASIDVVTLRVRRSDQGSPGDLKLVGLKRGEVIEVLSPVPFTRYNTYAWADALASSKGVDRQGLWGAIACISDARCNRPGGSLREVLTLDSELSPDEVRAVATDLKLGANPDLSHIDVDALLDEYTWQTLPESMRCHLLLELGAQVRKDIILVEHQVLSCAEPDYLTGWWAKVAGCFVLVRHNGPSTLGQWRGKAVLAMRTDRAKAVMSADWAKSNYDVLNAWFAEAKTTDAEDESDMMDEDDE